MYKNKKQLKIIAEIPARAGSKRVKNKNMRLLNYKPLISYAIQAAKESTLLTDIYVNSDNVEMCKYGESLGIKSYRRPEHLANDTATSDEYNYDFFKKINPDFLVQINPVCPFVTAADIDATIQYFIDNSLDSLVTVREERFQAFCDGQAVNFDRNKQLPRTQDLSPILLCAWPVCIWEKKSFIKSFEENGNAVFAGKLGLYPVSFLTGLKISYEKDFILAEKLMSLNIEL